MCLIVDTNSFSPIFNPTDADHPDFKPILDWITSGKGKIIYGGSKYKQELAQARKYLKLFTEFKKINKIVEVSDEAVDTEQRELEGRVDHRDFDDPHLVAIAIVSRCKLICSKDERAHPFIKDKMLYPDKLKPPKIYSNQTHMHLLNDKNIVRICK